MLRVFALATFLAFATFSASAQLQYFGYVGGADDDQALAQTKGFTNFAWLSTSANINDPFIQNRISAMTPAGIKAIVELGKVLWCDYDNSGRYLYICGDWLSRWNNWKTFNASVLTPDKVIVFVVRDEPFRWNADMYGYDQAAAQVKSDFPWAKILLTEAVCVVRDTCDPTPSGALSQYRGQLPSVDWLALDSYAIWPKTDTVFNEARDYFRWRFPNRKWGYALDGWWAAGLHGNTLGPEDVMQTVAHDWYDVAQADPNAVILGVFAWYVTPPADGSQNFPCGVLSEHVRIGRAITGRSHTPSALPVGQLESVPNGSGLATGWACYPDGQLCENPSSNIYYNGGLYGPVLYTKQFLLKPQCGTGTAYRFQQQMGAFTSGYPITVQAHDPVGNSVTLPSNCPESPACIWYSTAYDPKGYMEAISPTGAAAGWVCDPDAPQVSSKVRLALDNGTQIGIFTTNLGNEQAVADECRGGYLHRFSVQLPAVTGCHQVYAYAQDLAVSWNEKQIPWLCPQGWSCEWCVR